MATMQKHAIFRICTALIVLGLPWTAPAGVLNFNALSPEKEAAMGIDQFEKYKQSRPIIRSGADYQSVQRVAARLMPVVDVPNAKWEFVLFDDPSPNAFALPGGKVGVHSGLFKVVKNDAQLAAVLGHELGHVTARHSGQRITQGAAGAVVGALAGKVLENKTGMDQRTAMAITQGAATLRLLKFSRKQELEADQLGATYMAQAGYDPHEAIRLWENFSAYKSSSGGPSVPAFLSTHPVDSRRIEELKSYLPTAMAQYNKKSGSAPKTSGPSNSAAIPAAKPVAAKPEPAGRFSLRDLLFPKRAAAQ
jgi:predicted Zn-dependent protease